MSAEVLGETISAEMSGSSLASPGSEKLPMRSFQIDTRYQIGRDLRTNTLFGFGCAANISVPFVFRLQFQRLNRTFDDTTCQNHPVDSLSRVEFHRKPSREHQHVRLVDPALEIG